MQDDIVQKLEILDVKIARLRKGEL